MEYVFQEYPKTKYHARKAPVTVQNREEEEALGKQWKDNPAEWGIITAPGSEHATLKPISEQVRQAMGLPNAVYLPPEDKQ